MKKNATRSNVINGIDVAKNVGLVHAIAGRYRRRARGAMQFEDLVQAGMMGLCIGAQKFDHGLGVKVSTYVSWWVMQAITRELANCGRNVRLPVHVLESARKMRKSGLEVHLPGETLSYDVSSEPGKPAWVEALRDERRDNNPELLAIRGQRDAAVKRLRAAMPPRERWVLDMRDRGSTLVECAQRMPRKAASGARKRSEQGAEFAKPVASDDPLSRERIRQLQVAGRKWIRDRFPKELIPDGIDC